MTECESVRGTWGGICPDCGVILPNPGPIRSWMARRHWGSDDHRRAPIPESFYRRHREQALYGRRGRAA